MVKAKGDLAKIVGFSKEEHKIFIENKQQAIVNFHLQNNNFYKNLVGEKGFESWEKLPVLNKQNLQKALNERLSNGFSENKIYINKTSGSSGDPFVFAKDKYCHALTWA